MGMTELVVVLVAASLVAVLGVGRLARVIIYDAFPPAVWLRIKWDTLTDTPSERSALHSWNKLLHCPWCLVPWLMLACIGWYVAGVFVAAWIAWAWWLFWGWLALSYVASMIYVRDERP